MKFLKSAALFSFLTVLGVALFASTAHASANITLSPSSGTFSANTFSVDVYVSGNTQPINAVSGTLSFPTALLSASSVDKTGSIISLWAQEPSISNSTGTVSFEGVILNPGFSGTNGKIVTIRFARKAGTDGIASLRLTSGSVLANDGNATNVLGALGSASFTLSPAAVVPPPAPTPTPTPVQTAPTATTNAPVITSSTHPTESGWYNTKTATFSWALPSSVNSVRLGYSKSENAIPGKVYTPPIKEKTLDTEGDGAYSFAAQFKIGTTWGPVSRYRIQIDTKVPDSFTVTQKADSPIIAFGATDDGSGIMRYEIVVDNAAPITIPAEGFAGTYDLSSFGTGTHTVTVRAFDKAGNATSTVPFVATLSSVTENIKVAPAPEPSLFKDFSFKLGRTASIWLAIILAVAVILALIWLSLIRFAMLRMRMRRDLVSIADTIKDDFVTLIEHFELAPGSIPARTKAKTVTDKMIKNAQDTLALVERDVIHKIERIKNKI